MEAKVSTLLNHGLEYFGVLGSRISFGLFRSKPTWNELSFIKTLIKSQCAAISKRRERSDRSEEISQSKFRSIPRSANFFIFDFAIDGKNQKLLSEQYQPGTEANADPVRTFFISRRYFSSKFIN